MTQAQTAPRETPAVAEPLRQVAQPLAGDVQVDHFVVNLTGSQKQTEGTVWCNSATIYVSGSSTLVLSKLVCTGKVTIRCVSSSFVHIGTLDAAEVDVNHGYSSSMYLGSATCRQTFAIDVHFSSRLDIAGGTIDTLEGSVTHTSFVRCVATVRHLVVWVDDPKNKAPYKPLFGFGSSFVDN